ncbi:AAA family ATPase [Gordonia insulae]|uniref:NadR/Ttd14 AAA domain-containing protein n=1 Tax=Gordonia insulae TaxID=2420509 RepID=A0A3G8JQ09_9ACTN|nr:AAA family ATPase [Gordonia insulae]AZG47204.1 hypothetical protein D7316_03812 [Gordonia insulae]
MRIGVSGPHGTGKTTLVDDLCTALGDHVAMEEPYHLLEDEGHEFAHPPSPSDYRMQLTRSIDALNNSYENVVFDRTPMDFLAYLAACGADLDEEVDADAVRAAMAGLDLLVLVPISGATEKDLPEPEMLGLRAAVNESLIEVVYADDLEVMGDLRVIELAGPLDQRVDVVLAALR